MKKIITTSIVCIFAVFLFSANAYAYGNIHDTRYGFYFSSEGTEWVTEYRDKLDDTSSYMHCYEAADYSYNASVHAVNPTDSYWKPIDVGSPEYTFWSGSERWLANYVIESGYDAADIKGWRNTNDTFNVEGVWSPDSV